MIPTIVKAIRIHHPDRLPSWRRLTVTANPGMGRAKKERPSRIVAPPNDSASRIDIAIETNMAKKVHHQYSDSDDLVRNSKYLRNPENIDSVKLVLRYHCQIAILIQYFGVVLKLPPHKYRRISSTVATIVLCCSLRRDGKGGQAR